LEEVVEVEIGQQPLPKGEARWIVEAYCVNETAWQRLCDRLGWRVYATTAPLAQVDLPTLVRLYRHQVLHERTFSRLKTRRLNLAPVYLRDDQRIVGLTWLLELALRVLTLTEFGVHSG